MAAPVLTDIAELQSKRKRQGGEVSHLVVPFENGNAF